MIRVADLSKAYGPVRALDRVSFEVSPGEILGFLGPNGAGKSTTLRILTGFLPPDSGSVTVAGFDIRKDSLKARSVTGYLPEGVPLYPEMRVGEYLRFRARLKAVPRTERRRMVSSVLARAGVSDVERRDHRHPLQGIPPAGGAGGCALGDPRILILDEPTVGLDPEQLRQFRGLLLELGRTRTIVLSTHNLSEVEPVASRVAIIFRGRLVAQDAPAALRRRLGALDRVTAEIGPGATRASPEEIAREVGRLPQVERAGLEPAPAVAGGSPAPGPAPNGFARLVVRPRGESDPPGVGLRPGPRPGLGPPRADPDAPLARGAVPGGDRGRGPAGPPLRREGRGPVRTAAANVAAIFRREVASYFLSPVAYVTMCLFLLVNGWIFYYKVLEYQSEPQQINLILGALFGAVPFWALFLSPVITMRLLAEEKRTGTLEALMTAPVTSAQVVLGKFLAAELFFVLIWSTLLIHVGILLALGSPDLGPVFAVYIGLASLGVLMNGLGLLASAITRNQIIAVIVAFLGNMLIMFGGMLRRLFPDDAEAEKFFDFIGIPSHFTREYYRGVVDLRYIALDLLVGAVLLCLAVRALEARKWR